MSSRRTNFVKGIRDGFPIALGYFAVSFALGIKATEAGLYPWQAGLMSFLNVTSAGEAAAIALLGVGTTYMEIAFTQLVINIRYLLMSCALSQRLTNKTGLLHRFLIGYGVTDEIFGISVSLDGEYSPYYTYGAIAVAVPGWTLGTLLGSIMGNLLPWRAVSALSVALYAMFIAIILPPAKKSKIIAGLVAVSMLASAVLTFICSKFSLEWFTEGFRIIALTIVISLIAAILFPVKDKEEKNNG
ncbi:MAG: AzlC family ABC transporter permease [Clostridia bacterium]|nr:AzlC family ABC transporter permease [Clostridia bacterium]